MKASNAARRPRPTVASAAVRPARHPWSEHWPRVAAGVQIGLGVIAIGLLMFALTIPTPAPAQQLAVETIVVDANGVISQPLVLRSPALMDAITRLSAMTGHQTVYSTHGDNAVLVETLGQKQNDSGRWVIYVNGEQVTDMAPVTLQTGDEVKLVRQPAL